MTRDERQEYADMLREAQSQLFEAIETLAYVARETEGGDYYRRTIIAPLEIAASHGSIWISRDPNIDQWITALEGDEDTDEDEEDNDVG